MVIREELPYPSNSYTPKKKPKNGKITDSENEYNKALVKEIIIKIKRYQLLQEKQDNFIKIARFFRAFNILIFGAVARG
ncbi:hypothetical protein MICAI_620016 [Microcystis sp. T1-4]|nr:hypothetical protein MICAI_620016 [Microcystis sp. T1-4]